MNPVLEHNGENTYQMRKVYAVFVLGIVWVLFSTKISAQDFIFTVDDQIISAVITEIDDSNITYKMFDNQEGPNIKIATSKVRMIRFSNGTEKKFTSRQVTSNPFPGPDRLNPIGYMTTKRGDFYLYGRPIAQEELGNYFAPDALKTINSALKQRKTGKGLLIPGCILTGVGALWTGWGIGLKIAGRDQGDGMGPEEDMIIVGSVFEVVGIIGLATGVVLTSAGIPLLCISKGRLKWAVDDFNSNHSYDLSIKTGKYGTGIALNF